jgi:nucleotide-binding universal stress UspA family protein
MAASTIFLIGVFTATLLAFFVYVSVHELKKGARTPVATADDATRRPLLGLPGSQPLKILVATDGSQCAEGAVQSVAERPWPKGSEIEVMTVVHTNVPFAPEFTMMGVAAYATKLDEDRRRAPQRVQAAERGLAPASGVTVSSRVLEGNPAALIIDEATRWKADLVIVGSHGYGRSKHGDLGPVAQEVTRQAPCSVEIVRQRRTLG